MPFSICTWGGSDSERALDELQKRLAPELDVLATNKPVNDDDNLQLPNTQL